MNDTNDRIAIVRGWTWQEEPDAAFWVGGHRHGFTHWRNPKGKPADRPDFTGTLEGVAGMMRELQEEQDRQDQRMVWSWNYCTIKRAYRCNLRNVMDWFQHAVFWSPDDRPGDCVGEAWMSVKEAADAV